MMDVDQPVSSTTDNEKQEAALDGETSSQENAIATELPEVIVRENDDLPALLISDSEEEDDPSPPPSKAPTKEVQIGDISGISPIETTVENGQDDKSVTEETVGSETNGNETLLEAPAVCAGVDEREEDTPMENIDLTGASSADDSGVSEEQSGERTSTTTRPAAVTPKAQTKSSSEMTAQELLESLLDAQEEAFASHRASELGAKPELTEAAAVESKPPAEEVDKTDTASVKEKITTNNPDSSTLLQDEKGGADDNGTKIDTVVIDDECLLEEMSNAPAERQQEMDIDDHRTGSSNSSCSADGPNHISDGSEKANEEEEEEADEGEEKNDEEDSEEPPRKRARSMVVAEDSATETTTGPTSHGMEHGTVQNETRSDGLADESGNLAKEQLDSTTDVNLSEDKPKSAADSLEQKSTTPLSDSCSSASANGGPLKKQCIEVGGQQNVKPVEPSVCPDVLVIDDDDEDENDGKDDAAAAAAAVVTCKSNLPQETDAKNQDAPDESKLKTDIIGDNTAKRSESDSSNEKIEKESIPMEFLRNFNKPLSQMTRTDLEQLVLQKITEAIVHRSENAELRRLVKRQSAKLQGYERTITDMTSQYEGLKLVAERAVIDMKKRAKSFIAPVKITRAVGLQVSRPGSDMVAAHRLSNFFNQSPDKRKPETGVATVTTTTNGAAENGEPGEVANHITQPTTAATVTVSPFPAGQQQNTSANMNRAQFSNNKSPMNTPRFITTNPAGNGINRTMNQQIVRHNNSVSTANVNITLGGNALRFTANPTNDVSVMSTTITATVENVSPKTGSASSPNSAGGIDSPVRKFHKFTPKRPPLSAYQQAQQEKQAKQQQELLVQQIHEQSQQQAQQRKAQITIRQDVLPAVESSSMVRSATSTDASVNRQRPMPPFQGRLLNVTTPQAPATQNYQLVSVGAIRPVASSTLTSSPTTTTLQLSEIQTKPNAHPTTEPAAGAVAAAVSPPVNGSLIDLTDEDDTTTLAMHVKRAKTCAAPSMPSSTLQPIASNQLIRIQHRINAVEGGGGVGETVVSTVVTSSSGGLISQYNNSPMVRVSQNANRANNAAPVLQPIRHPIYNSNLHRLPASTEIQKKRVVLKPQLAPLPNPGPQPSDLSWKMPPPQPSICVNNVQAGIVISWTMPTLTKNHATIETYQIYAYQELSFQTASDEWRHVGDVKALLLPMAVTLTQFHEGQRYFFAVRAIDVHKRVGKFCEPRTWNDTNVAN